MVFVGYAGFSTADPLGLQRDALTAAGCERLFTDTASGFMTRRTRQRQTSPGVGLARGSTFGHGATPLLGAAPRKRDVGLARGLSCLSPG